MNRFFSNKWVRIGLGIALAALAVFLVSKAIISGKDAIDTVKAAKETAETTAACIGL